MTADEVSRALQTWVDRLTTVSGARPGLVPDSTALRDWGQPFYQVHPDGTFSYEAWDRGSPCMQRYTTDVDELMYWIVDDLASSLAQRAAMQVPDYMTVTESRRLWFPLWREWITAVNPNWGDRTARYLTELLAQFPYR